jgi:hypothetical protein
MSEAVKVGPWGAPGGQRRDVNAGSRPQRLKTITVSWASCNGRITGFSFSYVDQNDEPINVGPWGTIDWAHSETITIGPHEQLNLVMGTFDNNDGVTSLVLNTNQSSYGPYGIAAGPAFIVPLRTGAGEVVAFFGSADDTLNALGVYVLGKNGLPVMIGPWGDSSNKYINQPIQLKSVVVHSTQRIHGFSFTYIDENGNSIPVGPWGSTDQPPQSLPIGPGEYVSNIIGTFDANGVTSLEFFTNKGGTIPKKIYGRRSGTFFSVPLPDNGVVGNPNRNGAVLGFFGRSGGDSLAALGVYVGVAPEQ